VGLAGFLAGSTDGASAASTKVTSAGISKEVPTSSWASISLRGRAYFLRDCSTIRATKIRGNFLFFADWSGAQIKIKVGPFYARDGLAGSQPLQVSRFKRGKSAIQLRASWSPTRKANAGIGVGHHGACDFRRFGFKAGEAPGEPAPSQAVLANTRKQRSIDGVAKLWNFIHIQPK